MPTRKLLIFPCSGTGIEALDCLGGAFDFIGFIDDDRAKLGHSDFGYEVFSRESLERYPEANLLAVPGSPSNYRRREGIILGFGLAPERFATVIHAGARVSPLAKIGFNTLIMAGVVITSDAEIGNHVCVLPNTVIHHGARIGDFALVGSNVTFAGDVLIGRNAYIGSSSSVIGGATIGEGSLIGMGSNVIRSIPPFSKAVGNPARIIGEMRD
jgi:sugar O-acyltransferase (sialic acid O-acetyltransferase NeuD family)